MAGPITLRAVRPDDEDFLYRVYCSTRAGELALTGWDEAQKAAFLRMQFDAQHRYYQEHYTDTAFLVIERDGCPVGRLYVARWEDEIRIVDIALLPEFRGAGIGSGLIADLQAEAVRDRKPVRIHVEKFNPALRLYQRLGFAPIADRGVYLFLEWSPGPADPAGR